MHRGAAQRKRFRQRRKPRQRGRRTATRVPPVASACTDSVPPHSAARKAHHRTERHFIALVFVLARCRAANPAHAAIEVAHPQRAVGLGLQALAEYATR